MADQFQALATIEVDLLVGQVHNILLVRFHYAAVPTVALHGLRGCTLYNKPVGVLVSPLVFIESVFHRPLENQMLVVEDVGEEYGVAETRAAPGRDIVRALGYSYKLLSESWLC